MKQNNKPSKNCGIWHRRKPWEGYVFVSLTREIKTLLLWSGLSHRKERTITLIQTYFSASRPSCEPNQRIIVSKFKSSASNWAHKHRVQESRNNTRALHVHLRSTMWHYALFCWSEFEYHILISRHRETEGTMHFRCLCWFVWRFDCVFLVFGIQWGRFGIREQLLGEVLICRKVRWVSCDSYVLLALLDLIRLWFHFLFVMTRLGSFLMVFTLASEIPFVFFLRFPLYILL